MTGDVTITWNPETVEGQFSIENGDLSTGQDLRTAVLISLFSWRRADPEDVEEGEDVNGYWGDSFSTQRLGSKLWLLLREKLNAETVQRARDYVRQALQWMLDDGVARRLDVQAERVGLDRLYMAIDIFRQDGERVQLRFDDLWGEVNA